MTLTQVGYISDSEYGSCEFDVGRPSSRVWTKIPDGQYYLTIWTGNTNPNCCLIGDISVSQSAVSTGESCTKPPPGPLEILHDALNIAGLIPALGSTFRTSSMRVFTSSKGTGSTQVSRRLRSFPSSVGAA